MTRAVGLLVRADTEKHTCRINDYQCYIFSFKFIIHC